MSDCRKCADFEWCVKNEDCGLFKAKPETNADRIRNMTDEELAEFLDNATLAKIPWCSDECPKEEICSNCALEWLKKETD